MLLMRGVEKRSKERGVPRADERYVYKSRARRLNFRIIWSYSEPLVYLVNHG